MKRAARSSIAGFFPQRNWSQVTPSAVQAVLRTNFERWGLPQQLRVDNGAPWGSMGELPPVLALWLLGLGVDVHWNRPYHCQANGIVERDHGILAQWVEVERCADYTDCAQRLAWASSIQRDVYPVRAGQSRRALYPELATNRRRYQPDQEATSWQCPRVGAWLAQGVWQRKVDQTGTISIYNWPHRVGRAYAGQTVSLRFEVAGWQWVVRDPRGQVVGRWPAQELTTERICSLTVSRKKSTQAKPHVVT